MLRALDPRLRLAVACALLLGSGAAGGEQRPRVVVSVAPMAQLVERLAGDAVALEVLVPRGADVESYSPTPQQMVTLARADLVFAVGHPAFLLERRQLDPWLATHPEVARVLLSEVLKKSEAGGAPAAGDHDPHLWVSPRRMRAAAGELAAALVRLLPDAGVALEARRRSLDAEIAALDAELGRRFAALSRRSFLIHHPALGHLARDYGLEQVAIEHEGKEPSPAGLARTIAWARAEGIRVVLVQRGQPARGARIVAGELGATTLEMDPLDPDWLAAMRRIGDALAAALDHG